MSKLYSFDDEVSEGFKLIWEWCQNYADDSDDDDDDDSDDDDDNDVGTLMCGTKQAVT